MKSLVIIGVVLLAGCSGTRPGFVGNGAGKLAPCPQTPNCVLTTAIDSIHLIAPLTYADDAASAMNRLIKTVSSLPRTNIIANTPDYLYVEFTSKVWRFVDDVEFSFDSTAKVIHFRSASRLGKSDIGVNRARMEQIRTLFGNSENSPQ
jgi:uncharacterized protein (DUF1499 family)